MQEESSEQKSMLRRQLVAFFEVLGVATLGVLLTMLIIASFGLVLSAGALVPTGPNPDYLTASFTVALVLAIQYVSLLMPAFLVGYWHRRRSARNYGLTTNTRSISYLILLGVAAWAIADLPAKLVRLAQELFPIPPLPVTQAAINYADWIRWDFWLFLAIGSFVVIPIVEELFYRGYIQTRLAEDFGGLAAVLISSAIFAFGHVQYVYLGVYGISNLIALIIASLALGYLYHRTKSLIPSIVLHAIANIPAIGLWQFILPPIMILIVVAYRRPLVKYATTVWQELQTMPRKGIVLLFSALGAIYASLAGFGVVAVILGGLVLVPIALFFEYREKQEIIQKESK